MQAEERVNLAASVFNTIREGVTISDAQFKIIEVNDTFTKITGYSRDEALGQDPLILQSSGRQSPESNTAMWQTINTSGYWVGEVWYRRKNGEVYPAALTKSAVKNNDGKVTHYTALFSDITKQKEHQSQLEDMANYDVLTGLPNRTLLADRLNQAIIQSNRDQSGLAVVFLDIDNFKEVNDTHGHNVGDRVLIAFSSHISGALREVDTLARIGGDEFIAVLTGLAKFEEGELVLERILLAASETVTVDETIFYMSASIGVTYYPQDNADADILMRHADQAMYLAKQAGKNRYHLFDTEYDDAVNIRRESLDSIISALDKREFVLHYQPKVNMATGEIVGVEALIRWQHPVRGLVSPLDFLPIIEGQAISIAVGEWVINTALDQISQWQSAGITLPISVNISPHQLQQTNFVTRLTALLASRPEVSPYSLELEVLETGVVSDINSVSVAMVACKDLGVHFALDDFGTGYSSLTHLRHLPARWIKIDQSFVRDILVDSDDLAIIKGIISLSKAFQRNIIAEGVETIEHGTALLELGCELAQGYGIARPMPASDIPVWADNWKPDIAWRGKGII
ncbi:MAG: diguanylate cyclase (GGDEF)-like protein/PAS domain S-box-containing protein [Methylophilaceae bacterium]|jgi:diguanylate cyclase (GGDEF)-like protein/PAS domain S-box-containing protein